MSLKSICIDFDGVVHSYEDGWQDGKIYGHVLPGFFEWAVKAKAQFKLVIYSSRSHTEEGNRLMQSWIQRELETWSKGNSSVLSIQDFFFATAKPPAWVYIDDRAITFRGNWKAKELDPEVLANFKTWSEQ